MSEPNDRRREAVAQAVALAAELAPDVASVLLTHYPDADTLDTLRPGSEDLETVAAVNRAVAAELASRGVAVFVQVADRAAFRRWMDGRADTAQNRLAWRDRGHLLRGAAAMEMLGLGAAAASPPAKAAGSPADRLVRAFIDDDSAEFEPLANTLLASGRQGVLDAALRKLRERYEDEAAQDFTLDLMVLAEGAQIGPAGWAELVALPVALPPDSLPDPAGLAASLLAAGAFPDTLDIRFLPQWRSPEALAKLPPCTIRRVLVDLVGGREPADLPPAKASQLNEGGFGVLLGIQLDWSIPVWEDIAVNGLPQAPAEDEVTPEDTARGLAFDRWRTNAFEAGGGCVPLALVPASEVEAEIADFLEEAGEQVGGLQEIRDFVEMARREVPGEEVVCRPEIVGDGLELSLYTGTGKFLDSLSLSAEQLPARAAEMPRLIEAFVPLRRDAPH
ncbi:MAG: hypothetical protein JWP20_927 [Roseomonas sp.]|jgi:hypothetical protein|nr:hypothetical protein [Roseomonas sp.]